MISSEPNSHTDLDQGASGDAIHSSSLTHTTVADEEHQEPQEMQHITLSEKKNIYKARLSYKIEWKKEISLGYL